MKSILIAAIVLVFSFNVDSAPSTSGKGERLRLKLIKHQPCSTRGTQWERIRFSSSDRAPLKEDPSRGSGCYTIQGPVTVKKEIKGTVQVYTEVKFGMKSSPEPCKDADGNGCGGVGSCVYCDTCDMARNLDDDTAGLVRIDKTSGGALNCRDGLKPGTYDNIKISFCLPTKEDVLKKEGMTEEIFNENVANGQTFFATIYMFNKAVNTLSFGQLQNAPTVDKEHVIGCHKIVGNVFTANNFQ